MKEALFCRKKRGFVQCLLCPHLCALKEGEVGKCRSRKNIKGTLFSLVYGKPCATNLDPIEKKPLFHFLPGTSSFSIGTFGCNMSCMFCQNADISQRYSEEGIDLTPEEAVDKALSLGAKSISYTYNEPTIFIEYILDIARLARKRGLKNILVSNGFINREPALALSEVIDAANIDLKAFDENFYGGICGASLKPVLDAMKLYSEKGLWLELTTMVIPGKNDSPEMIEEESRWIRDNLGRHVPLHFSRFSPLFRMSQEKPTPLKDLEKVKMVAGKYLDYIYLGNVGAGEDTLCPDCGKYMVRRHFYDAKIIALCCCKKKLPGVFS